MSITTLPPAPASAEPAEPAELEPAELDVPAVPFDVPAAELEPAEPAVFEVPAAELEPAEPAVFEVPAAELEPAELDAPPAPGAFALPPLLELHATNANESAASRANDDVGPRRPPAFGNGEYKRPVARMP